ncbi:MAG: RagB/SusD family nutrient uptake outer membrane protein [Bacteroides sp.]|nr:RagB/SusD family nutrient uptake outer membrane protein [Bacteroides sp.]
MKKIYSLLLLVACLFFKGCDMEKYPYDAIEETQALENVQDFRNVRNGIYSTFRTITTGSHILMQEIQADEFNAVLGFSNTYGDMYRWTFVASSTTLRTIWSNYNVTIARCNFLIDGALRLFANEETALTESEIQEIQLYLGEAYFTRAFCHFNLAIRFCKSYDSSTAETDLGLPIQLTYNPGLSPSEYPGRSSMKDTYGQIVEDLDYASTYISTTGVVESNYITTDAVVAMQARVALEMGNDDLAISSALALINSSRYSLIDNASDYWELWKHDTGTEAIWQIAMPSLTEIGAQTGSYFIGIVESSKDYIPSDDLLSLYDKNHDIRFATYFDTYHLTVASGASGTIYFFNKYPGNERISSDSRAQFVNQTKVFRISEMYLIAAEAYANKNDLTNGAKYLNELAQKRILGYTDRNFTSVDILKSEIRDERQRELVCEGHRMMDLKRWKLGVTRTESQNPDLILFPGQDSTEKLRRDSNDPRMVWPIPQDEIDANPQIRNQQNPGY